MKAFTIALSGMVLLLSGASAPAADPQSTDARRKLMDIAVGQSLYTENCASCHGVGGRGDGVVAKVLKDKVPDLTRLCMASKGRFPTARIYSVIDGRREYAAHGSRLMPIWGMEFWLDEGADEAADVRTAVKIHHLLDYLKTIQVEC